MINTENILDDVISRVSDQSAAMRTKMLIWLNNVMQDVTDAKVKKPWMFLQGSVLDNTISSNAIAKPADFKFLVSLKSGIDWFLKTDDLLTEEEIFTYSDTSATDPSPIGYEVTSTTIVLYPGASGTCDLKYVIEVPEYADVATDTVFPLYMKNVLISGTLVEYYKYDQDPLLQGAPAEYGYLLAKAMKNDNIQQPKAANYNRRGYIRK